MWLPAQLRARPLASIPEPASIRQAPEVRTAFPESPPESGQKRLLRTLGRLERQPLRHA
jgi:hypothetical protein